AQAQFRSPPRQAKLIQKPAVRAVLSGQRATPWAVDRQLLLHQVPVEQPSAPRVAVRPWDQAAPLPAARALASRPGLAARRLAARVGAPQQDPMGSPATQVAARPLRAQRFSFRLLNSRCMAPPFAEAS